MNNLSVSIIVLTFSRPDELVRNISELLKIEYQDLEIIVVDNCSVVPATELISSNKVKIIRCHENLGVAGRNVGIKKASGDIIFTIDDDVYGLNANAIEIAVELFLNNESLSAVNFKIIDDKFENQINWIHHKKIEDFGDLQFGTYEISEGAVAFRKSHLDNTNLYPEYYFISHEGPDLALQLMKAEGVILYEPRIVVRHAHSPISRESWRRYYYDTRNQIWLATRHYPCSLACRKLFVGLLALFIYSVRDGYLRYYIKGVKDAFLKIGSVLEERVPLAGEALKSYLNIEKENAGFLYMVKKRIFSNRVKI